MVFSVLIAAHRHPARRTVLRAEPGDLRAAGRARCAGAHRAAVEQVLRRRAVQRDGHRRHVGRRRAGCGPSIGSVVDGAVNGTGWLTVFGVVVLGPDRSHDRRRRGEPGRLDRARKSSFWFRRLQTGLVQNYALLMLFGIFAFVSIYLVREVKSVTECRRAFHYLSLILFTAARRRAAAAVRAEAERERHPLDREHRRARSAS